MSFDGAFAAKNGDSMPNFIVCYILLHFRPPVNANGHCFKRRKPHTVYVRVSVNGCRGGALPRPPFNRDAVVSQKGGVEPLPYALLSAASLRVG